MSEQSAEIGKLATALAKAQGKMTGALKDSSNPFFKSKYADLAAVIDALRGPLADNELAYIQTTDVDDVGVTVVTTLAHASGEWMRGKLRMLPKDSTPQGFGSAITYARRYALAAIAGVAQVDDDANAASGRGTVVDPRGEIKFDEKERDKYVSRFRDAFGTDVQEDKKADLVHAIHMEIGTQHDLYIAVGDALGAQGKKAIREYVKQVNDRKKIGINGRAAA